MLRDIAHTAEHREDGRDAQRGLFDLRAQAVGNAAGDILIEAAARDVADSLDINKAVWNFFRPAVCRNFSFGLCP